LIAAQVTARAPFALNRASFKRVGASVPLCAEQGLVVKRKNVQDGRSTLIHSTAAGKKLLMQGRERRVRSLAAQIVALSAKERTALGKAAQILRKVITAI
jgi:DNA-binding MarR family transcriptional regulator